LRTTKQEQPPPRLKRQLFSQLSADKSIALTLRRA
jgi:hypothetical protein